MAGQDILEEIVVKISYDRKGLIGTGFFISEKEIVTCYHVLEDEDALLSEYFVKKGGWDDWISAKPIKEKSKPAQDFAFLICSVPIKIGAGRIPFQPWDRKSKEFRTYGYDCNTPEEEGASTIEGDECKIVGRTYRGTEPRWQLSTFKKSILEGRSGSPIWSVGQESIVGMIDYGAADENEQKEKSTAILVEQIMPSIPPTKGQPINAPKLPADFLDRPDDLVKLKELILSPGEDKSAITGRTGAGCMPPDARVGLQGMGGIGKSVLAAALAWDDQVLEAFPDGVIWISLGQKPDLASRHLQLLRFLDEDHRAISDVQDGLGCLRQMLRELSCLIILDDVWSVESVRAFDALGPDCRMLVTTRDREIVRGLKAREYCLDVLDEEKAMQLLALSSGLKPEDLDPKAREVAEECDRLPLALAMVGSMARAALDRGRGDPWEHILHRLRTADLEKIKAEFPDYPYPNLLRAIEVSVESLKPEDQRRYLDLAVFPEEAEVPEAALRLIWDLDEYDTRDLADLLADRSLARFSSGRLGLHDLQQYFAVKRAGDPSALHNRLVDAYRKECPDGWHSGPDDGYFFYHLAYHLLQSGRMEELKRLLLDLRWLQARLEKTYVTSLISDYDLLPDDEEIGLLQHGLRLSSHVLFRDGSQLPSQLLGRMQKINLPGIKWLMQQAGAAKGRPWLRPMTASLTPPGGPLKQTMSGHSNGVYAIATTPNGRHAVSGSRDYTLKVWDLESGQEVQTLSGHIAGVKAVALTPDGMHAVSASDDKTLKVWDLESGHEVQTLSGHVAGVNAVALTPDGMHAVSASDDKTLKVWDLESGHEVQTLFGHAERVNAVALTPDGMHVVSASDDKTLKIWDLENGHDVQTLIGHNLRVNAIAITSDGLRAISASDDGTLKIWDLERGQEIQTLYAHNGRISAIALATDGLRAVSGSWDNTLKVWDLESGQELQTLFHAGWIKAVALTSDGQHAISGSANDGTIKVWDLDSDPEMRTLSGHADWIFGVAISSDGRRAVSASEDRTLKIWDLESGQLIQTLHGHTSSVNDVAITPDGRRAVSASADRTLKVWDLEGGQLIQTLHGHTGSVNDVSITPDGRRAISASDDGTLKVWDLEGGLEIQTLFGNAITARSVDLTNDGQIAISGSNIIEVWDLKRCLVTRTLASPHRIFDLDMTPDGHYAVSVSYDRTLVTWDLHRDSIIAIFAGDSFLQSCSIADDGRTIVAGEASGRVHFLRLEGLPAGKGAKPQS